MTKKITSLVLAIITIISALSLGFTAFAEDVETPADDPVVPEYAVISAWTGKIELSGINATCTASVVAQTSTSLKIKMELQKYYSSGYETVKTWTKSKTGINLSVSGSKVINPLSSYRLKVTITAGSETVTAYKYP